MDLRKYIRNVIEESLSKELSCPVINATPEMISYVNKFDTDEQLLRSGGLPIELLDRAAFGFSSDDIKELQPKQLKIKWKDDWINVKQEQERSGLSKLDYAKKISLEEPIDVSFKKGKFYVEDGHHRLFAAAVRKLPLKVKLEIDDNPMIKLAPTLGYDDFHRCLFKQVKENLISENNSENKIDPNFVYNYVNKLHNNGWEQTDFEDDVWITSDHDYFELKEISLDDPFVKWNKKPAIYSNLKTDYPPIVVSWDGWIIDGMHRSSSARERGDKTIMAYMGHKRVK